MEVCKAWMIANGDKEMSKAVRKRIVKLRKTHSWRALASHITNGEDSNQLLGMWLCQRAGINKPCLKEHKDIKRN